MAITFKPKKKVEVEEVEETEEEEVVAAPVKKKKVVEVVEEEEETEEEEVVAAPVKKKKVVPVVEEEEETEEEEVVAAPVKKKVAAAPAAPVKKAAAAPVAAAAPAKKKLGGTAKKAATKPASTSGTMKDVEDLLAEAANRPVPGKNKKGETVPFDPEKHGLGIELTKNQANFLTRAVFSAAREVIKEKGCLKVTELFIANVKSRPARIGRNPKDGSKVKIPATIVVNLKASKRLKEYVKGE
jgi:DNA-binding protein HU-beta